MTDFDDFIDASDLDLEPPEEARERLNEVLRGINPVLYGDGDGGSGSGNVGPKVQDITVTDSSGAVYEFEADAFDPEDSASQLTYEWQVDGQAVGDDSATLAYPFQSEGDVDVTATVTDTGGKSHSRTRTVSISLPAAEDRFTVNDFGIIRPFQPQGIEAKVTDADGDDDVLALRLSVEPDDETTDDIEPDSELLTDLDGPVESIEGELTPIDGFGSFIARLEAVDLDRYSGTVSTPFDGDDLDDDDFVELESVTALIQD